MATVVATVAAQTADNRCVGGGESSAATMRPQVVPLPSSAIPALKSSAAASSVRRRLRRGDNDCAKLSRSSTSSCSSSPSSSSDEDEDGGDGGRVNMVTTPPMAAKRLKDLQQHLVDLDDLELLDRHLTASDGSPDQLTVDVDNAAGMASELRQKNKDLVLAARLGKALLAKNDELSLMNERLAEEYGDKLEVCIPHYIIIIIHPLLCHCAFIGVQVVRGYYNIVNVKLNRRSLCSQIICVSNTSISHDGFTSCAIRTYVHC